MDDRPLYRNVLLSIGKPSAEPLSRFLSEGRYKAEFVLEDGLSILGEIGDPAAVDVIINIIQKTFTEFAIGRAPRARHIVNAAVNALIKIGDPRGCERLLHLIELDSKIPTDSDSVNSVIKLMGRLRVSNAVEMLLDQLHYSQESGGGGLRHKTLICALGDMGDARAIPLLKLDLETPSLREDAQKAIEQITSARP